VPLFHWRLISVTDAPDRSTTASCIRPRAAFRRIPSRSTRHSDSGVTACADLAFAVGGAIVFTNVVLRRSPVSALVSMLRRAGIGQREALLIIASVSGAVVAGDLLLRAVLPPTHVTTRYGWPRRAELVWTRTVMDTPGRLRTISVRYSDNGFKKWGNVNATEYKLFVIGDSFTEMAYVSNGEEWYSKLANELRNAQLFVYGGAGYGSLQEYMVLDDYIDAINPDGVLWQFCDNDYDNNLYELDVLSYPYNNHGVRPYLEGGRIVYKLPLPYSALRTYSFVGDRLLMLYDGAKYREATRDLARYRRGRSQLTEEQRLQKTRLEAQAFDVTLAIMRMVSARSGGRPVYMFNAGDKLSERENAICSATGIICLPGISEYVAAHEGNGVVTRITNDGHWNMMGNQLAGEKLASSFRELGILKKKR